VTRTITEEGVRLFFSPVSQLLLTAAFIKGLALFKGMSAPLSAFAFQNAITFYVYGHSKRWIDVCNSSRDPIVTTDCVYPRKTIKLDSHTAVHLLAVLWPEQPRQFSQLQSNWSKSASNSTLTQCLLPAITDLFTALVNYGNKVGLKPFLMVSYAKILESIVK